jgi:hypothetical protein
MKKEPEIREYVAIIFEGSLIPVKVESVITGRIKHLPQHV